MLEIRRGQFAAANAVVSGNFTSKIRRGQFASATAVVSENFTSKIRRGGNFPLNIEDPPWRKLSISYILKKET